MRFIGVGLILRQDNGSDVHYIIAGLINDEVISNHMNGHYEHTHMNGYYEHTIIS